MPGKDMLSHAAAGWHRGPGCQFLDVRRTQSALESGHC